jgi:hypothetical protein
MDKDKSRPGVVPKEVYVRARSIANKYIRADGSEPVVTDEDNIEVLKLMVRAAGEKVEAASLEYEKVNDRYKRRIAEVRFPLLLGFAQRCLGHVGCCGLRETQIDWLRQLARRTVELKDHELKWRGLAYYADRAFGEKDEMERAMRIWLKIKAYHEIEDATAGIEWEIEQEVARREEQEAEKREWRAELAARSRLPVRWQTPELVEIVLPGYRPPPEKPSTIVVRRR